jgi:hydrogenase nickel incorporation protein HypB
MIIEVKQNLFDANQKKANVIRDRLKETNTLMLDLIGSPGAGKTTLLERTLERLTAELRIAVIEGDVDTNRDAERLRRFDIPTIAVNTGGACHLESVIIENAISQLDLDKTDLIFIENVGNLVCPAEFDLGDYGKIAVSSVPEGDDKPMKYPVIYRDAKAVILNKSDLMEFIDFDLDKYKEDLFKLNPTQKLITISAKTEDGLEEWIDLVKSFLAVI